MLGAHFEREIREQPDVWRAIAISDEDPDLIVYASRNRLFLSRNGGVFWSSLPVELPEIDAVAFPGS